MSDAWVIGHHSELAAIVTRSLSELGIGARLAAPGDALPATGPDGGPSLVVLIDEVPRTAEQLAGDPALAGVPVVVPAEDQRLAADGLATVGHELVVHPFSIRELQARVSRARQAAGIGERAEVIVCGTLELDTATYEVRVDGRIVDFTFMEYELLRFFVTHPDRVFSREALLAAVWGDRYDGGARTVDVHVRRLRAKLGQEHAERIRTLRSVGYRWEGRAAR